jgi:hypothetical protein
LEGEQVTQKKIDELANLWEKTKDPKYKDLWYKLIKEYTNGINNLERGIVSTDSSHEEDDGRNRYNR